MDIGVVVWLTDLDLGVTDFARTLEQAGIESLFMIERTHVPVSRRDVLDDPAHARDVRVLDQFIALGAAAAVTSRLRLGTSVCVVPQHDPILLAKQVATLDYISGGRFLFGVGAGWFEEEMRNHGVDPAQRWDIMREHLMAMKEIWGHEQAEFHGTHVDFDPLMMWPKPHAPILVAAYGPKTLRMTAELGDGWFPIVDMEGLDEFDSRLAVIGTACREFGRAPVEVTVGMWDLDERLLAACADRGVRRCAIAAPVHDPALMESFLDQCARLGREYG
ncbi:MAG: LLM class F420-dependent oxidoreductase [Oryzihumus sp.]